MITRLEARNFKRFKRLEVELGGLVVHIGPNNKGKTTALQALALWQIGVNRWNEKRKDQTVPGERPGVTINRRDLVSLPVPSANLLWHQLHVREGERVEVDGKQKQVTRNIRIDIVVEGVTEDRAWKCGLEFDYANEESLYCRPLRLGEGRTPERMTVPPEATGVQMAFLPPMSGLAANETRLDPGAISVRIGEGRTAEVLRNVCHRISSDRPAQWRKVVELMRSLFGSELEGPRYIVERGEVEMRYEEGGTRFDLQSNGRGFQQTLLLLAYMYANPGAVLLLDEPDAHLEILRQRQVYQLLTDVARENGNQIIAASHSEVLLNEAAGRDIVVAFVGKPHRINDRGSQVLKALKDIGFEHYYQAEQTGWVLYLEGSSDLAILRAFAEQIGHPEAIRALERPFVHYVANQPSEVRKHFFGLREAVPGLVGVAVFDRLDQGLPEDLGARGLMWQRREVENYLCYPETLEAYARATAHVETAGPLFTPMEAERRVRAMQEAIAEIEGALATLGKGSPWGPDFKASDDFLVPVFEKFFRKLGLPNIMAKKSFHELASLVPAEKIDPEVRAKLDAIAETASRARPLPEEP